MRLVLTACCVVVVTPGAMTPASSLRAAQRRAQTTAPPGKELSLDVTVHEGTSMAIALSPRVIKNGEVFSVEELLKVPRVPAAPTSAQPASPRR
ncbi:MAG: hypothetical protein HYZ58_00230 [Acidobacteria bacterium]|nr:hypothetical protein [Acidobacteriota bacterium]MBI3261558.1 hypothetical protein [Acidobacteriota bacterium]